MDAETYNRDATEAPGDSLFTYLLQLADFAETANGGFRRHGPAETPDAFLGRLVKALAAIHADELEDAEAAQWVRKATQQFLAEKPIDRPDGFPAEPPTKTGTPTAAKSVLVEAPTTTTTGQPPSQAALKFDGKLMTASGLTKRLKAVGSRMTLHQKTPEGEDTHYLLKRGGIPEGGPLTLAEVNRLVGEELAALQQPATAPVVETTSAPAARTPIRASNPTAAPSAPARAAVPPVALTRARPPLTQFRRTLPAAPITVSRPDEPPRTKEPAQGNGHYAPDDRQIEIHALAEANRLIWAAWPELTKQLIANAQAGCLISHKMLQDRIKPRSGASLPMPLTLDGSEFSGDFSEASTALLRQVARGDVSPGDGSRLLQAMGAAARNEVEERISALEQEIQHGIARSH